MNRHNSDNYEACRLAKRAQALRSVGRHREAELAEVKALELSGYQAPVTRLPVLPYEPTRLPVARKLARVLIGALLALGLSIDDCQACNATEVAAANYEAGLSFERARSEARALCESATVPGTIEEDLVRP